MGLLAGCGRYENDELDNFEDHGCCKHLSDENGTIEEVKPSDVDSLIVKIGMKFELYTKTRIKKIVKQNERMLWALKHIEKMISTTDETGMIPMGSIQKLSRMMIKEIEEKC